MISATMLRSSPSTGTLWGRLAARLHALTGWRRGTLAVLLGALAALALPPVGLVPILALSIPGLVWLLDSARSRRGAFAIGWCWGLGWSLAGLYWIANALLLEPEKFGWMVPFATLGLSSVLGVFSGAACWAAAIFRAHGPARLAILAACWTICEWLRSWVLTGFPWNPLGSVWDGVLPVLQTGSVVGVFGLSLLTMLFFALPALLADMAPARQTQRWLIGGGLALIALASGGLARLSSHDLQNQPDIQLRLVQASVDQRVKGRRSYAEQQLFEHITLSRSPGWEQVTHVVWPETASPFFLDLDDQSRSQAAMAAPAAGLLLTGAPRMERHPDDSYQIWNSLLAVTANATIAGVFDKAHLVPFGEYVPLRSVLKIPKITLGGTDFSPGPGPRTMDLPNTPPVSPLICYEGIFPAAVVDRNAPRPQWLLTITNDGWFGISAGPYQHVAAGRMRAVEEGLPLVRAANTGISAIIDPLGRTIAQLGLGERGIVDGPLPLPAEPTLFSRYGNTIPLAISCLLLLICTITGRRTDRTGQ